MNEVEQNTKKYGITSFIFGLIGVILSILMYVRNNEAIAYAFLILAFAAAALSMVFANLEGRREPQNKLKTAGFVFAVITLMICMSMVWFISFFSCLGEALSEGY